MRLVTVNIAGYQNAWLVPHIPKVEMVNHYYIVMLTINSRSPWEMISGFNFNG